MLSILPTTLRIIYEIKQEKIKDEFVTAFLSYIDIMNKKLANTTTEFIQYKPYQLPTETPEGPSTPHPGHDNSSVRNYTQN